MKIIEKIEIKHFRSFLGTPQSYETEITNINDLNIFSGANDSGKSNILRALNLFFNGEISYKVPFEFDRDFFVGKKDSAHKVIEIGINFDLSMDKKRDKFLPEKFKISKFYDRNGFRNYIYSFFLKDMDQEIKIDSRAEKNKNIKDLFIKGDSGEKEMENANKREWIYRVKFTGFLNKSVVFEYVPAIRDRNFFSQLFGRVIMQIKSNEDGIIESLRKESGQIENWNKTIKNKTIKKDFKENLKNENWRIEKLQQNKEKLKNVNKLGAAMNKLEEEINQYSKGLLSNG